MGGDLPFPISGISASVIFPESGVNFYCNTYFTIWSFRYFPTVFSGCKKKRQQKLRTTSVHAKPTLSCRSLAPGLYKQVRGPLQGGGGGQVGKQLWRSGGEGKVPPRGGQQQKRGWGTVENNSLPCTKTLHQIGSNPQIRKAQPLVF